MTRSIEKILHDFPHPRGRNQTEALADYFQSKKTKTMTDAARTNGIAPTTASEIEDAYEQLTEEEQKLFDLHLMSKRLGQSEYNTIETLADNDLYLTINS